MSGYCSDCGNVLCLCEGEGVVISDSNIDAINIQIGELSRLRNLIAEKDKELDEAVSLIQALQRPIKEYLKLIEGKEVHSGMSESLMSLLKNRQLEFLKKVGK